MYCNSKGCSAEASTTWVEDKEEEWVSEDQGFYIYGCNLCQTAKVSFWVVSNVTETTKGRDPRRHPSAQGIDCVKSFSLKKSGQWPPWEPKISNRLLKNLGEQARLFRRGIACLGEGLGIGAAAYFRRVIEDETDAILDLIKEAAELDGDQAALENVRAARKSKSASDGLKLAAEKVPASLRPGGRNPLAVLYAALSGAVHTETEEEALQTAETIMKTLVFLFEELKERMTAAQEYAADLHRGGAPR
jgi:hypothetical protein